MALNATLYHFDIDLSDSDRGVYQTLSPRVAKHPSETDEFLITRLLAYCLEYREGLSFSKGGLSTPDEPALAVHDLTGVLTRWIDVGLPEPARLHRASKASSQVAVYSHKDVTTLLARLNEEKVHRVEEIEIYTIDRDLIDALTTRLTRRMKFSLVATDRQLYLSIGAETFIGSVVQHRGG